MTDFHNRPLVYLAGPYSHPDPVENTRRAILTADELHESGLVTCHVPHLTLLWHLLSPHPVEHWYGYDLAVLARCDALLRLAGGSTGADAEMEFAGALCLPVFGSTEMLLDWAQIAMGMP